MQRATRARDSSSARPSHRWLARPSRFNTRAVPFCALRALEVLCGHVTEVKVRPTPCPRSLACPSRPAQCQESLMP
jgi:hypothetical protein